MSDLCSEKRKWYRLLLFNRNKFHSRHQMGEQVNERQEWYKSIFRAAESTGQREENHENEPSTSNHHTCHRTVPVAQSNESKSVKSIMKNPHTRSQMATSTVTFQVPETVEETDRRPKKLKFQDRCKRFSNSPIFGLILLVVFGILLPCIVIYVALYYLNKIRTQTIQFKQIIN
uniref:uncharacterized protein LOC117608090 n=1 Tax=Osmia lignaria TaxID=473952 RepID=UPI001478EED0|nr:uncharacterized protein LOC117608090 [Osmia lignaria]